MRLCFFFCFKLTVKVYGGESSSQGSEEDRLMFQSAFQTGYCVEVPVFHSPGPRFTYYKWLGHVLIKEPTKKNNKTKVIKLLHYIQVERDIQICLTTDTEHASHPAAC